MNSEFYKLGYAEALVSMGIDLEKTAGRADIARVIKNIFRKKPALPSAAATESAAMGMGSIDDAVRGIRSQQAHAIPAAPPKLTSNPDPFFQEISHAAPTGGGMQTPRHPSTFFGGHPAPKGSTTAPELQDLTFASQSRAGQAAPRVTKSAPTQPSAPTQQAPATPPAPSTPAAPGAPTEEAPGMLSGWWQSLPNWQKGVIGVGGAGAALYGGSKYMNSRGGGAPEAAQQFYGQQYPM